jgi:hypothetical protein
VKHEAIGAQRDLGFVESKAHSMPHSQTIR